jgi:hypothetical protein
LGFLRRCSGSGCGGNQFGAAKKDLRQRLLYFLAVGNHGNMRHGSAFFATISIPKWLQAPNLEERGVLVDNKSARFS